MLCCFGGQPKKGEEGGQAEVAYVFPKPESIQPVTDSKQPSAERKQPNAENKLPAVENKFSTAKGKLPAAQKEQPNAESKLPAAEIKFSTAEVKVPAVQNEQPTAKNKQIVAGKEIPIPEKLPRTVDKLPLVAEDRPLADEKPLPKADKRDVTRQPSLAGNKQSTEKPSVPAIEKVSLSAAESKVTPTYSKQSPAVGRQCAEGTERSFSDDTCTRQLPATKPQLPTEAEENVREQERISKEPDADPCTVKATSQNALGESSGEQAEVLSSGEQTQVLTRTSLSSEHNEHRLLVGKNRSVRIYRQDVVNEEFTEENWCIAEPLVDDGPNELVRGVQSRCESVETLEVPTEGGVRNAPEEPVETLEVSTEGGIGNVPSGSSAEQAMPAGDQVGERPTSMTKTWLRASVKKKTPIPELERGTGEQTSDEQQQPGSKDEERGYPDEGLSADEKRFAKGRGSPEPKERSKQNLREPPLGGCGSPAGKEKNDNKFIEHGKDYEHNAQSQTSDKEPRGRGSPKEQKLPTVAEDAPELRGGGAQSHEDNDSKGERSDHRLSTPGGDSVATDGQKSRVSRTRSCPTGPRELQGNRVGNRSKSRRTGDYLLASQQTYEISTDDEVEGGSEKKWARTNSLRRQFNLSRENNSGRVHHQDPAAHSDTELGKISASHSLLDGECGSVGGGSVTSERGIDVGRVASWATSFEKLLEDPAGLHTFAEFLKKEYSHENIYFWTACERYKRLSSPDELQAMAKVISERHLCIGASEPVNVDSQARQDAQDSLHNPNEFLFSQAQKQIFNLMKFDSYSRFLKSSLYQDCLSRDMRGQTLPYPGDDTLDPDLKIIQDDSHVTLKKSKSDADERRRKSLLPWHRKDRSKSKDRGEAEYRRQKKMGHRNQSDSSSVRSDMSGSRTSLNSSDLGRRAISKESLTSGELGSLSGSEGYNRCRVILPDLSNSVVAVRHGDTIQELLTRLLERRGISYSTFDVYQNKSDKLMDKNEDSMALGGLEVRIERRILFRLDLPNRKTVCVKAKPNKLTSEVLKPILHKYGYKLDLMSIHKVGEEKGVNLKCHVNEIDGDRLVVQTKEEVKEWGVEPARQKKRGNSLDEITNRVFEDLLKGKSQQNFDELGILDFDARSSRTEHSSSDRSSGITGGFSLRNSLAPEKDIMSGSKVRKPANRSSVHDSLGVRGMMPPPDHALITKRRGNSSNPPNAKQENDELYEGLKRAQRSRLDDQRGTEINFELPDFLKCDQPLEDKENQHGAHLADQLLAHLECSFSEGGVIPSHQEAEDYFSMAHPEVWGGIPATSGPHSPNATLMAPDLDLDDFDDTLVADDSPSKVPMPDASNTSLHVDPPDFSPPPPISMENSVPALSRMIPPSLQLSPPPPLPPKPKLGGTRGPPPRPPSRQLHLLNPPTFSSSTSDDDTLHPSDHPPIHAGRQQGHHDKFNISFV